MSPEIVIRKNLVDPPTSTCGPRSANPRSLVFWNSNCWSITQKGCLTLERMWALSDSIRSCAFRLVYPAEPCVCLVVSKNHEFRHITGDFRPYCDAIIIGSGVDDLLIIVQEIYSRGEVVNIASDDQDQMNQASPYPNRRGLSSQSSSGCLIGIGASPDSTSIPCSLTSGRIGLRPRRAGIGRSIQSGIHDRALAHRHTF